MEHVTVYQGDESRSHKSINLGQRFKAFRPTLSFQDWQDDHGGLGVGTARKKGMPL
jgi:hypothetical protein